MGQYLFLCENMVSGVLLQEFIGEGELQDLLESRICRTRFWPWIRNFITSLDKSQYMEYGNCESGSYNDVGKLAGIEFNSNYF